jgi:hypothetical protein
LERDFLICTSSFLKAWYLDRMKLEGFLMTVSAYGIRVANRMFPNHKHQRIHMPLHSHAFTFSNLPGQRQNVSSAHYWRISRCQERRLIAVQHNPNPAVPPLLPFDSNTRV